MKKRVFFKILISLVVLSSVLLSSLLGVTKAEYFKSLSKKFDLEANPDLTLEYYIYDADSTTSTSYAAQKGVYKNTKNFTQRVTVGKLAADLETGGIYSGSNWTKDSDANNDYSGASIVYQIKIPIDEPGYYTLDFAIDITMNGEGQGTETFSLSYDHAIGCEILNHNDGFTFGNNKRLDLWSRNNNKVYIQSTQSNNVSKLLDADGLYQWKTMSPSRQENVSLSFKVEQGDVDNGYVLWMWDFEGLYGPHSYVIDFTDVSVNKVMNLDGTTNTRTSSDPYFLFPQAKQVNNQLLLSLNNPDNANDYDRVPGELEIRGSNARGKTSYSRGRGNFVTEATENSLTLQAETILYGYHDNNTTGASTDDKGWVSHLNSNFPQSTYTNPISFRVPLKNIEYNTTYKVSFDFSVARQGTYEIDANGQSNAMNRGFLCSAQYADYAGYGNLFKSGENLFSSYIDSGSADTDINRSVDHHKTKGMALVQYNDKTYQGKPLTKYDEITSLDNINNITVSSVNDTYAIEKIVQNTDAGKYKSTSRNWFNAVQHTEYNGQNKINWLTFYNTSFSFNIKEGVNSVDLNDLYWVWAIDSLLPMSYYRIRLDNVRIEKVVEYASSLNKDGIKIGGVQISQTVHSDNHEANGEDGSAKGIFSAFRGQAGTGQNYQSKGFVLNEYTANKVFTNESNIYSPVIDASRFTVSNSAAPYKIELNGFAVCQGGINKYVYSVDGGNTWQDMTFTGISATSGNLSNAEKSVDQYTSGTTRYTEEMMTNGGYTISDYDHVTFTDLDAFNGNFDGWKLVADLSEYKHLANLDIIIAAVPETNTDLRCEILRIINFNQIRNYRTYANHFISDITVRDKSNNETRLNACYTDADGNENEEFFTLMRGCRTDNDAPSAASGGYSLRCSYSHAYEDVRTLFSDFPVYDKLTVTGWAIVEGGVDKYVWTADYGKTWHDCTGSPSSGPSFPTDQRGYWYDGNPQDNATLRQNYYFEGAGGAAFTGDNMLTADLLAYEGQVVDVIFAAKPNESDVYVPVGRIDNVGVYGQNGTFFTRLHRVILDQSIVTEEDANGTPSKYVPAFRDHIDGTSLDFSDKWPSLSLEKYAYTIFETQNVNAVNSRLYNNQINEVKSGGIVTIDGFVICKGGVSRYKFSLDGGKTWTVINDTGANIGSGTMCDKTSTGKTMISEAKKSDASFDVTKDGAHGDYCCYSSGTKLNPYDTTTVESRDDYYDHALEFNLPALPDGEVRNLLVVAESTYGKLIPVLNIKLKFYYKEGKVSQYGYYRSVKRTDSSKLVSGWVTENQVWNTSPFIAIPPSKPAQPNNLMNRTTIPVTEAGLQTLTFNHKIDNPAATKTTTNFKLYNDNGTPNGSSTDQTKSTVTLTANKTHYLEGEPISVTVNCTTTHSGRGYGTVTVSIISEDWLNHNGEQHAIYGRTIAPVGSGQSSGTVNIANLIGEGSTGPNRGLAPDAVNMRAGTYSIVVFYRHPEDADGNSYELSNILATKKLRDMYIMVTMPIYIHSADEKAEFSIVHDAADQTYFSDISKQFTAADRENNKNIEHVATLTGTDLFSDNLERTITADINVRPADVKRGYVVLDADYTGIMTQCDHTKDKCEDIYGDSDSFGDEKNKNSHTDDTCVSRKSGNGSTFTRKKYNDTMYTWTVSGKTYTIKHPGVKYKMYIKFGTDPLTPSANASMSLDTPIGAVNSLAVDESIGGSKKYLLCTDPLSESKKYGLWSVAANL